MKYISVITPNDTGAPSGHKNPSCYLCIFCNNKGDCIRRDITQEELVCTLDYGPMIHWLKIEPKLPRNILVL